MARHERRQSEWPITRRERIGDFVTPDGYLRSSRPLTGPLRFGTTPEVGPRGPIPDGPVSDFEMDRVTPRRFDPFGTQDRRSPPFPGSYQINRRR